MIRRISLLLACCLSLGATVTLYDHPVINAVTRYVAFVSTAQGQGSFKGPVVGKVVETFNDPAPGVTKLEITDLTFALPDDYAIEWSNSTAEQACQAVFSRSSSIPLVIDSEYGKIGFARCGPGLYVWGAEIE